MRSRSTGRLVRQILLHLALTPLALLWLFPLWMMVVFSTLPENGIFSPEIRLLPGLEFWTNFQALQAETGFLRTLFVSVVVALVTTAVSVMLTSMAGWALVRYRFRGRWLVIALIFGTLTLPYFVVVIPQFIMVARDMGLSNTWFALIVPPLFNSLGVLFMRQAFTMMPADLFDAAQVEGVSEWRIFTRVALPMARPTIAALCIILFLASWNNYLWPLLIASQPEMMTAPVALGTLIGFTRVSWASIMTGAVLLTLPMLLVFVFLQRFFMSGITAGAVK
jgi:lactose/L-arabinose transport system permease protein